VFGPGKTISEYSECLPVHPTRSTAAASTTMALPHLASSTTAGQTSRRSSSSYVPSSIFRPPNLTQPLPTSTSTSFQGRRRWLRKDLSPHRICREPLSRGMNHPSSPSATSHLSLGDALASICSLQPAPHLHTCPRCSSSSLPGIHTNCIRKLCHPGPFRGQGGRTRPVGHRGPRGV
jgi:hypothetical protein